MSKKLTFTEYFNTPERQYFYNNDKLLTLMVGETPLKIDIDYNTDEVSFHFKDAVLTLHHDQDCCEQVVIEDVTGDPEHLLFYPIIVAEERVSYDEPITTSYDNSNTWTFYTFRSLGGSLDIRFHGSSNGYYSESISISIKQIGE